MYGLLIKGIFLTGLFLFVFLSLYLVINFRKFRKNYFFLILLLLLGLLIAIYIRFVVYGGVIFASTDESNYINLIFAVINNKFAVISGPGFVYLMIFLNYITRIDYLVLIPLFAAILTAIYPIVIYLLYNKEIKNKYICFLVSAFLLITTYFLWPMIESRPQQLGMIFFFISSIFFYRYIENKNNIFLFILFYILTFIYHILSFFVLSIMILIALFWKYSVKEERNLKRFFILSGIFFCFILIFLFDKIFYYNMSRALVTVFKNYPLCLIYWPLLIISFILLGVLLIFILGWILRRFNVINKLKKLFSSKILIYILSILIVFSLVMQFFIKQSNYLSFYNNSYYYFFVFQISNIVFGLMFIYGIYLKIKNNNTKDLFFRYSIILMFLGFILLLISLFSPGEFNNGVIRIIGYWTFFAAPIAIIPLMKIKSRFALIFAISILLIIGLISVSKDPQIFNYKSYWDKKDIDSINYLCHLNGNFYILNANDYKNNLSHQELYNRLYSIVSLKGYKECSSVLFTRINETVKKDLEYVDSDIRIYRIKDKNVKKPDIIDNYDFNLINKEWNLKCPVGFF